MLKALKLVFISFIVEGHFIYLGIESLHAIP